MTRGAPFAIILAGFARTVAVLIVSFPILSIPVIGIVVFLVRQKRPNVTLPLGLLSPNHFYIVDDSNEPVPITPDVEDHMILPIVGIRDNAMHFLKSAPAGSFHG